MLQASISVTVIIRKVRAVVFRLYAGDFHDCLKHINTDMFRLKTTEPQNHCHTVDTHIYLLEWCLHKLCNTSICRTISSTALQTTALLLKFMEVHILAGGDGSQGFSTHHDRWLYDEGPSGQ